MKLLPLQKHCAVIWMKCQSTSYMELAIIFLGIKLNPNWDQLFIVRLLKF